MRHIVDKVIFFFFYLLLSKNNINGIDKRELYTIINCIGVNETSYIHLALVHFYGNKSGENIYKSLKKENFVAPSVQWTKETRMKKWDIRK